jgi:hypothetical protein
VGGRGHSLDGRHNRYSYVATGTAAGFGGEAMELNLPWSCQLEVGGKRHRVGVFVGYRCGPAAAGSDDHGQPGRPVSSLGLS